jgi:phosphoenolpyruvate carboxylase
MPDLVKPVTAIRTIPTTMASQHPDHAAKPWWHSKEFLSTHHEVRECFIAFSELGIGECKWDWEGKFVDESVIEKLYSDHFDYFSQHPIGKEKFITYRLPNPRVESEFRLGRAYMGILGAASLARQVGMAGNPLFEVILPMTETAEEMIAIQESFQEIAGLKHKLYNLNGGTLKHIEIIPLFEHVEIISTSDQILREYFAIHKEKFGFLPDYFRPYVARSDPAMNSGIVPTVAAIKIALAKFAALESETGIQMFPIIGSASLPFRGGLTPYTAKEFANEYQGVRTALIQSAFRYDFPTADVIEGIRQLDVELPQAKARPVSAEDDKKLRALFPAFESPYRETIEAAADLINELASALPKRRERVQHIGLFGYSRGVGNVRLPRAIGFTGAMYSLGIPPELIGTGRGLAAAKEQGQLALIESVYLRMKADLRQAGRYLNKANLQQMAATLPAFAGVLEDVRQIEIYLGEELGPQSEEEIEHGNLAAKVLRQLKDALDPDVLRQAAVLRRSLG